MTPAPNKPLKKKVSALEIIVKPSAKCPVLFPQKVPTLTTSYL